MPTAAAVAVMSYGSQPARIWSLGKRLCHSRQKPDARIPERRPSGRLGETPGLFDEAGHGTDSDAAPNVGEGVGARSSHALGVRFHDAEVGADQRREIDLVDDEEVG